MIHEIEIEIATSGEKNCYMEREIR